MFYFGTRSFTAFVNLKISLYFFLLNSWKGIYGPYNMVYSIHTPYVNLLFLTLMQTLDDRMFGALKSNSEQCSWPSVWFSKKIFETQIKKWVATINLQLWYELRKPTKLTNPLSIQRPVNHTVIKWALIWKFTWIIKNVLLTLL